LQYDDTKDADSAMSMLHEELNDVAFEFQRSVRQRLATAFLFGAEDAVQAIKEAGNEHMFWADHQENISSVQHAEEEEGNEA